MNKDKLISHKKENCGVSILNKFEFIQFALTSKRVINKTDLIKKQLKQPKNSQAADM